MLHSAQAQVRLIFKEQNMSNKNLMTAAERKAAILEVGVKLSVKYGSKNVTRRMVAEGAKVSEALVTNYFGNAKAAQAVYARALKKKGLAEPTAEKQKAMGAKLRSHDKEKPVTALKKVIASPKVKVKPQAAAKVAAVKKVKVTPAKKTAVIPSATSAPKKAARQPKAPPSLPELPAIAPTLPPLLPPIPSP